MKSFRTRSLVLIGSLLADVAAMAVVAPAHADIPQMRVHYNDLDLQSVQGQKTLARRVNDAADLVCQPVDNPSHIEFQRCRTQIRDDARAQLAKSQIAVASL